MTQETLTFSVGQPWSGDPDLVADPGFGWHADAGLLLLVVDGITSVEDAGLRGPLEVAVLASGPLVGLMLHLEGMGWQEAWSWSRWPDTPPALRRDAGGLVTLTLVTVEQRTSVVRALRMFTLSQHASRVLRTQVAMSWRGVTDDAIGLKLVDGWYSTHPSWRDSLNAALARSKSRIA